MDDPLFLLMQGVWLLAAGMYPLGMGFLFGACSACCDQCPDECSKCTQYWNQFNDATFCKAVQEFKVVIAGYGTLTGAPTNILGFGDCLDGVDAELTIEGIECNGETYSATVRIGFDVPESPDNCGCTGIKFQGNIGFFIPATENSYSRAVSINDLLTCEGGTISLEVSETEGDDCFAEFINSLSITSEVTLAPCDCGACCDGECEDDVAEGYCGNWAGVGTACDDDPDPCAEE
jgi:hypothetical protein